MNTSLCETKIAVTACLLAMAMFNVAGAHSSYGGGCASCHNRPTAGALDPIPPIDIQLNKRGLLTFGITSLGSSGIAALSVQKLGPPNSLPINANVVNGGVNGVWHYQIDSRDPTTTDPNKQSYISDDIDQIGPYTLDLGIGGLATPGTYPITVFLAGEGRTGTSQSFNLIVSPAALAGDFNKNGTVDAADYTVWRDGLGSTYTPADYNVWKTHFGETAAGNAAILSSAVPEPATLSSLVVGMLVMTLWRARPRPGNCS